MQGKGAGGVSRDQTAGDIGYDRVSAVKYARKWALKRNPRYYNFSGIGGDCANFASQCLYAGSEAMNYRPLYGWYYRSADDRTPSWSGVKYLYNFLTGNGGMGPWARECDLAELEPGDIIQLATYLPDYHHTLVAVSANNAQSYDDVLICAHSYDSLNRELSSYDITKIRFLHIVGVGR